MALPDHLPDVARPIRPCLTPRVAAALRGSERMNYPPDGGDPIPVLATDWRPPPLDEIELAAAKVAIAAYERYFAPADPDWLAECIAAIRSLFYVPELDDAAVDITQDACNAALAGLPDWAVVRGARVLVRSSRSFVVAIWVAASTREVAPAWAEYGALRRTVDPREQERARRRARLREEEDEREIARQEWNRQNPGLRPFEEARRRVILSAERERDDAQGSA